MRDREEVIVVESNPTCEDSVFRRQFEESRSVDPDHPRDRTGARRGKHIFSPRERSDCAQSAQRAMWIGHKRYGAMARPKVANMTRSDFQRIASAVAKRRRKAMKHAIEALHGGWGLRPYAHG